MMELQIFNHQDFGQIRVVEQDGEPLVCGGGCV
jgi:prophage antirepressor-like protein